MAACPQEVKYHGEGDVWTHTKMVCEALVSLPAWRSLTEQERKVLFTAALLHDVGKPSMTKTDSDGRITSRGHSKRGCIDARKILWLNDYPFDFREQVSALINYHMAPLFLLERDNSERLAIEISQKAECRLLVVLAEADALGRICSDKNDLAARIALFSDYCREQGIWHLPRTFSSAHSRFMYFRKHNRDPDYKAHDDTRCEVVLMSGLPGSGKDYWIKNNLPDWPVVSLDALRLEMGVNPKDNQGAVRVRAREAAREHLRQAKNFIWNATNLSRQIRQSCINLFTDYKARIRIVYVEAPRKTLFSQNRNRSQPVPENVIMKLMDRWEVPDITEAHTVDWVVGANV